MVFSGIAAYVIYDPRVSMFLMGGGWTWLVLIRVDRQYQAKLRAKEKSSAYVYRLDSEGVHSIGEVVRTTISWKGITSVRTTPKAWLFDQDGNCILLPRRTLTLEQEKEITQVLQRYRDLMSLTSPLPPPPSQVAQ